VVEIQKGLFESVGHVTLFAVALKLAQVNVLVTGTAGRFQRFIDNSIIPAEVAFDAGDGEVFAGQWVPSAIMINGCFFKSHDRMAGAAILLKLPSVRVATMTISAFTEGHFFTLPVRGVTFGAGQAGVFPFQRVAGATVIKTRYLAPRRFIMTSIARLIKRRFVRVRMAIGTLLEFHPFPKPARFFSRSSRFLGQFFMTFIAYRFGMLAFKGEGGFVMIKSLFGQLEPVLHQMAFSAVRAQLSVMHVGVTGAASRVVEQITERDLTSRCIGRFVAFAAISDGLVQTTEEVTGLVVVEFF